MTSLCVPTEEFPELVGELFGRAFFADQTMVALRPEALTAIGAQLLTFNDDVLLERLINDRIVQPWVREDGSRVIEIFDAERLVRTIRAIAVKMTLLDASEGGRDEQI